MKSLDHQKLDVVNRMRRKPQSVRGRRGRFAPEFVAASEIVAQEHFRIISPAPANAARHEKPDETV